MQEAIHEIIRAAVLAPSGHNTQPWKFSLKNNEIHILPDFSRRLPLVDPDDRELFISIGCALENMLIACSHFGFDAQTDYFLDESPCHIRVALTKSDILPNGLYDYIAARQSTRSDYDGKAIPPDDFRILNSVPTDPGVSLHLLPSGQDMEPVIRISSEGCRQKYSDKTFIQELEKWVRFNEKEAKKTADGLYTACIGAPSVPRWLGKKYLYRSSPEATAEKDKRKLLSSGALAVFSSEADDRPAWVNTGKTVERFVLTAAGLNLKTAFVSQALQVPALRGKLRQELGLGGRYPQFIVRLGYAPEAVRSYRRPLGDVLVNV